MDENTWRVVQVGMWVVGLQTAFLTAVMAFIWNNLSKRIEKVEITLGDRIGKVETTVNDIDKRLFGVETMLHMKDCCVLQNQNERNQKQPG